MKKTFLILLLFFISMSSSFAWTQVAMSANGFDDRSNGVTAYNYMNVNINSYCDMVWFHGSLGNQNPDSYLTVGAYDSINGLNYTETIAPSGSFQTSVSNPNLYWGSVQIYMAVYHAWAQVILEYGNLGRP